ncbi:MAG: type IX secretion system sortase PorU [Bacteroidia bacterium]|nr:type IX secretion system sortase PorU [Bacteroidia bacterium]
MRKLSLLIIGLILGGLHLSAQDYAANSVLKDGTWYKIALTETGIYKLDADFFSDLGINLSSINPRNIQIYGNGGSILPQSNSAYRHDDLVENAIRVVGEDDGSFSGQDHVLFYGEGPHTYAYNSEAERFQHKFHTYSDTNFYFLRIGETEGKRIEELASLSNPTILNPASRGMDYHEVEKENLIKSGRVWLGEKFDLATSRVFSFYMPDAKSGGDIRVSLRVSARSDVASSFQVKAKGDTYSTVNLAATNIGNYQARHYWSRAASLVIPPSAISDDDSLRIELFYNKGSSSRSEGWLDWFEIDYDKELDAGNSVMYHFSVVDDAMGAGQIADISIANSGSAYQVWNISDPTSVKAQAFTANGNTLSFGASAEGIRNYVAFSTTTHEPIAAERIDNQDLHGSPLVDYIIITNPAFLSEAERLAQFHNTHYGRSTLVTTVQKIYNEFSSGKQDVTAIRDFIRMFWVRSGGISPGFVNMFGDGTYIYKNVNQNINASTNYLPTYQSRDSWDPTSSYTSDDFFVIMEDDEGFWGEASGINGDVRFDVNTIDIPIGRLPIENKEQAQIIVDKIIQYATDPDGIGRGEWRSRIMLVADHKEGEGNTHVRQANGYSSQINDANACTHLEKIYMDNYEMITTAGVTRFPEGRQALLDGLDKGALIVNYTGHGGEQGWSNSRILENPDLIKMKNVNKLPAVITATCEFGRYDNPEKRSGAEIMTMMEDVGAIALFTTVRLVYSTPNQTLNANFYRNSFTFDQDKGRMPAMGEIMMRTKNATFVRGNLANINSRNFTLLGDPGLLLNYPKLKARITEINGSQVVPGVADSLKSLSKVSIKGVLENELGTAQINASGDMDVTVFDKPSRFTTRLSNYTFRWEKNRIFSGKTTVEDGEFEFEFVVPIDVSYEDGTGNMRVYFFNDSIDGSGCYDNFYVGGTDANAINDDQGPSVELFINDTSWVNGGITDKDPKIFARIFDENGINTVGSGIGHEITAVLDEDESQVVILNEFYEAEINNYKKGSVEYQLRDLAIGEHKLRIRVWDVANNAAEATTSFIVSDNAVMALDQILNYPNPFIDETRFQIGHNQAGQNLELEIEILNTQGQLVKVLTADFQASGNYYKELSWDGRSDQGTQIADGIYIYRVNLRNAENGKEISTVNKMVLLRK